MKKILLFMMLIFGVGLSLAFGKSYNVRDFGARPSLTKLSTTAIQAAIDTANRDGGGEVIIPKGAYTTGTLFLRSNVTIRLEKGVELFGSSDLENDYADVPIATEEPHFSKCLFYSLGQENITIIGHPNSEINGKGYMFKHSQQRPKLFRIEECKNVRFENVIFKNSGSWCIYFRECDNVNFYKCAIYNKENRNNDGMNYDGCSNVTIKDCNIQVEDDAICLKSSVDRACENFTVENCTVSSYWACLKLGTASKSAFKNITVRNSQFFDSRHGCIKILMVDGGSIDNVLFEDVDLFNCGGPIFIRLGNRGRDYSQSIKQVYSQGAKPEGRPIGTIKNITFRNMTARLTGRLDPPTEGMMFTGLPNHYIENVTLENIKFSYTGFGMTDGKRATPEEREADYPEQLRFGILPSYGLYARHIKGLKLSNVDFTLRGDDDRHAIVMDDVVLCELNDVTIDATEEAGSAIKIKHGLDIKTKNLRIFGGVKRAIERVE